MVLDRLSQRAKNVISVLVSSHNKNFAAQSLISEVGNQNGFGTILLTDLSDLNLEKHKNLSISDLLEQAYIESFELKHPYVGTEHLVLALMKLLKAKSYKEAQKKVSLTGTYPKPQKRVSTSAKKTPILDAFGVNLTLMYEQGLLPGIVEREEVKGLVEILLQKDKPCPLIVGDSGVGKAALVKLLAKKISDFEVSYALSNLQVIDFDLSAFLASVMGREGIEAGLSALSEEIFSVGNIILYVRDIHILFMPMGQSFVPPFASGLFKSNILFSGAQIIASTSSSYYQKYLLEDEDVSDSFTVLRLKESDRTTTLNILKSKRADLEKFHQVEITDEFINKIFDYSQQYIKSKSFPQKAVELLDKASSIALSDKSLIPKKYASLRKTKKLLNEQFTKQLTLRNLNDASKVENKIKLIDTKLASFKVSVERTPLTLNHLSLAISKEINVPVSEVKTLEDNVYATIEERLNNKIQGQKKAVSAVSTALIRSGLGLKSKKGPKGSFLFLGPTGVGKTELARALSEAVFGPTGLIKLDMSDFSEKHTVSRLVGAPPGYIGYNEGGELTEKISKNPYSVVLFDEIEKAHPDVLNILLQIMDDGILVDARGRSFDFTHSIVILTSNLGSELIDRDDLGFKVKPALILPEVSTDKKDSNPFEERLLTNLKSILRPELLNRFDDVVVFNRLSKADVEKILVGYIKDFSQNLKTKGFTVKISNKALDFLAKKGFSDEYGARALRRTVDKLVIDEVAKILLKKSLKEGNRMQIDFKENNLTFNLS